ncbi:hypothetical protein BY458DRAFT_532750 [Sporodiniella umbellata]|nr:hypothetical protein BY458DRAFT_532750 [Sporodiniella umbellata]
MHKNASWSGMNINNSKMGNLGNSMGLRSGRVNINEAGSKTDKLDAVELLTPFTEVICSNHISSSVAVVALTSIEKYIHYGIISAQAPRIVLALNTLISSVSGCKFEASDVVSDELVLLRILQVFEAILTSECGQVLSDENVCSIMESGLSMCCQKRFSEMLRKSAEHSMIKMIIIVFETLKKLDNTSATSIDSLDIISTKESIEVTSNRGSVPSADGAELLLENNITKPYGIPTVYELLRVLISLLNPHEHKHTNSMQIMALSLLNIALEIGGKSIGRFDILRSLVTDEFCKYVFQLAKTDYIPLLSLSLRVIVTAFDTLRPYLKLQQELFLFFLIQKLSPPSGAGSCNVTVDIDEEGRVNFFSTKPERNERDRGGMFMGKSAENTGKNPSHTDRAAMTPEVRELLLEYLLNFVRQETFMIDLWYNYDCDISCGNLFEELIQFLCKNSFPDPHNYSVTSHHSLCLDTICIFIAQMNERSLNKGSNKVEVLLERKKAKMHILEAARRFNESPEKGIEYLQETTFENEKDDKSINLFHFLRSTQQLDKKKVGEYLSKPKNFDFLNVYMRQFDFKNKRIDEALRMVLETFRLTGESQQILRVADTFAEAYFESGTNEIADIESAQILAYSVIMLNTDQHNPQIRHRMSTEQFVRNLKGLNNKENFSHDYLETIYEAIKRDEILMPEEHEGLLGFNYAWKQLQRRSLVTSLFERCNTSEYDYAMFKLVWRPLVAAFSCAFNTAQDDDTLERAITGFRHCATLAAHFSLCDAFDSIVINLAATTGLLENPASPVPDPIVDVAGQKYVISKLAVRFGRHYKGQLAAVVLFAVVTRHGNPLRKGWVKVLQVIRNLFLNSLLPDSMLIVEDFVSGTTDIPLKPKVPKTTTQQTRRDGSLLSTLSSYLLSPYSSDETYSRDPTEEEVEMTMCAVDCVSACKLQELFIDITSLDLDAQKSLLTAIRTVGYDTKIMEDSTDIIEYDPAAVLFLEFMVTITIRNANKIEHLW